MDEITFTPWPKIPRLRRDMTITEKIDGTNAAVGFAEDAEGQPVVYAQSRKRLISPGDDNYGFAKWVHENQAALFDLLGFGLHFGEWWGQGIQRGYGLDHKRFSLFNTSRWGWLNTPEAREAKAIPDELWAVPVIRQDTFDTLSVELALEELRLRGSYAAPGFTRPEGIIAYHHSANSMFKVTLEGDDKGKGLE